MADVIEIFADGTRVERDFTPKELAQREADRLEWEATQQAKIEKEAKRLAVIAKLEKLGITEDEVRLLLGGN